MNTTEKVISIRKGDSFINSEQIGNIVGVSRQRVDQILRKAELPTKAERLIVQGPHCSVCGKERVPYIEYKSDVCKECSQKTTHVQVMCSQCGKSKSMLASRVPWLLHRGQKHFFCDRKCHGKWLGTQHGFPKHPELQALGAPANTKWDWKYVQEQYHEAGLTYSELSQKLGIPLGTIKSILAHKRTNRKRRTPNGESRG